MSSLVPPRSERFELLDDPTSVLSELPSNLADIRKLNRWFGASRLCVDMVSSVTAGATSISLLDVATGSADIPLAISDWASSRAIQLRIVASDVSSEVLLEARKIVGQRDIILEQADARRLPWPDGSFDVVMGNLMLHHFSAGEASKVLGEMWRVARRAVIIVDLTRGYLAYGGTWLATHLLVRSRLTAHDGPLSVLRAYTPHEMRHLAVAAGLENVRVRPHIPFRQVLVAHKVASL